MEILGKDILGALTSIAISDNETFRELDERMKKEHGMRMNFSNLEFGEGVDPDQNVMAYFSRWHTQNANHQLLNPSEKLSAIQMIPQENGFIAEEEEEEEEEEENEEEEECEVEDVFHAVMHGIKYEESIDVKPFTLPGVYDDPIPEQISDQLPTETLEPANDTSPTLLCRLCAIPGSSMIDLFGPNEPFDNIVEKIEDCLPIVVKRTDTLPKQVCRSCLYKLELCHQFHKTVSEAEKQLTMFDGRIPGEIGTVEETYQASQPTAYDECLTISSDDDEDDVDSMPLSQRLKITNVVKKNPSNLKKLINYTQDFFSTKFPYVDDIDEDNSGWSWSDEDDSSETLPKVTSVLLDEQERFFKKYMLSVGGEFEKTRSDSELSSPKITTRSKSSNESRRKLKTRQKMYDYTLFGDKALLQKAFASEMLHCLICGHGFPTANQCHKHAQIHYSDGYYPCSLCDESFTTQLDCDEHNIEHIEDKRRNYQRKRKARFGCSECGKKFADKPRLQFHKLCHNPIAKPCHCIKCNRTFATEASLYHHVLGVHTLHDEYFCNLCGQEFRGKAQLNGHKSKHTAGINQPKKRSVTCADCGKTYTRKSNLIGHTRIHTGERPFTCDVCGKGYRTKIGCNMHRKSHFPNHYKCLYCDKSFTRNFSRNIHMRNHTRKEPSPCNICGKRFKRERTMQRHRKRHELSRLQ